MLTNTERQQIVEEVNAGTYGIDEALDDIAAAQKGEEVRKALYAEALVLNREGHAGSTDMIARQQIANLQTSVNGQISTLRTEVGDDIDDLETALNSGLATQNGKIAAQDATIANVVANYNVEYGSETLWEATGETGLLASGTTATLSKDVSNFDYVDIYSFCGNSNVLDTVPVDAKLQSSQGYALRWVNLSDPGSGSYKAYVRIIETRLHIIGTTLTIDHQVTYRNGEEVNISGAEITQSNRSTYMGELGIMKIVGRKITANTEIEDVRIGADGTEYASAGQAVRAQVSDLESAIPAIDTTLSVAGAAADAKVVGDRVDELKSALNIINPPLDITWTLGIGINVTGVEYDNIYTATSNAIYAMPGDVFATDSPTVDSNGKFLVYYVCEYAGSVFKKRTEFVSSVRSVVIGADTDNIRIVFGRYGSSGVAITQADIDTYVSIEFTQKAGAASLVKALAAKVDNLDTDTFIINRYAYQGNDVNDIAENTFYFCAEGTINNPGTQGGYFIQTILYRSDAAAAMQIAYKFDNGLIYYRRKASGTWRPWFCVSSHSIPSDPLYYAFGDSLTYSAVWTPKEEAPYYQITQASVTNQIPTRIANAIGAGGNYQNKGVGGAYFVGTGNNKIITAIQNTDLTNAKIITVAGGRNDSENTLGDKNSTVGDGTICGAIKEILEYLTTTYKQLQIVWIGVTPNTRDNSTVFTRVFAGGWSLNTFDEKVSELCAEYGVPYVNWKECTYIRHWADFSGAGDVYSHPNNENSYLQMGNYLAGKVSAFYKG